MSVLRYAGGKSRLAFKIIAQIEAHSYDLRVIISPFIGGGSIESILNKKYGSKIIANDKFSPLINFWCQAQQNRDQLVSVVKELKTRINKELFHQMKREVLDWLQETPADKDLLIASYYFAINRSSFSGSTFSGGFSEASSRERFTESSINRLSKFDLKDFVFYNLDFTDFLNMADDTTFIYLDPPYFLHKNGSKLYGLSGDLHENFDHERLAQILASKHNWVLSYNDCAEVRELYKNYEIFSFEAPYSMSKSKKGNEVLIFSKS